MALVVDSLRLSQDVQLTEMVGADFQGLVPPHDESRLAIFLMFQQSNVTSSSFFPLAALAVELEKLGPHLEDLFLGLLIGLGLNGFGEANDGYEIHIRLILLWVFVLFVEKLLASVRRERRWERSCGSGYVRHPSSGL